MGRNYCQYFMVEHNGDIYPCDFFVEAHLKLGNVMNDTWEGLQHSQKYLDFGAQKAQWNDACNECDCLLFCAGDCLKHRLPCGGGDTKSLSWLCDGWKQFYRHALPGFKRIAGQITDERRRHARHQAAMQAASRPDQQPAAGRNAPCPCGSGKKFKRCCGR
jgi:uncharacterized protein